MLILKCKYYTKIHWISVTVLIAHGEQTADLVTCARYENLLLYVVIQMDLVYPSFFYHDIHPIRIY